MGRRSSGAPPVGADRTSQPSCAEGAVRQVDGWDPRPQPWAAPRGRRPDSVRITVWCSDAQPLTRGGYFSLTQQLGSGPRASTGLAVPGTRVLLGRFGPRRVAPQVHLPFHDQLQPLHPHSSPGGRRGREGRDPLPEPPPIGQKPAAEEGGERSPEVANDCGEGREGGWGEEVTALCLRLQVEKTRTDSYGEEWTHPQRRPRAPERLRDADGAPADDAGDESRSEVGARALARSRPLGTVCAGVPRSWEGRCPSPEPLLLSVWGCRGAGRPPAAAGDPPLTLGNQTPSP
nr:translation initiation factor IF-2-like [Desmodus rotundus]